MQVAPPQGDEPQQERSYYRKRFTGSAAPSAISAQSPDEAEGSESAEASAGVFEGLTRRTVVPAVAMGAAGMLCMTLALATAGGEPQVSEEAAAQVFELQDRRSTALAAAEALPDPGNAERSLSAAHQRAQRIAELQNDYRHLTPQAAEDGELDPASVLSTRGNLMPYFASTVSPEAVEPWYLLDADRHVPLGTGIPMSFDSGFVWRAGSPQTVNADGTVPVVWTAIQTRPGTDEDGEPLEPAVLAVATADYDHQRAAFGDVRVVVTTAGHQLRLDAELEADAEELDDLEQEQAEDQEDGDETAENDGPDSGVDGDEA